MMLREHCYDGVSLAVIFGPGSTEGEAYNSHSAYSVVLSTAFGVESNRGS